MVVTDLVSVLSGNPWRSSRTRQTHWALDPITTCWPNRPFLSLGEGRRREREKKRERR